MAMSSCLSAVIVGATRQQLRSFGPAIERAGYRLAIVQTLEDIPKLHELHQVALLVYTNAVEHEQILSICQVFPQQPDMLILHNDVAQPSIGFAPYQRDMYDSEMIEHILSNRIRHHQTKPAEIAPTPADLTPETNPVISEDIACPIPNAIEHENSETATSDDESTQPTPDAVESEEADVEGSQAPNTNENVSASVVAPSDKHEQETTAGQQPVSSGEERLFSPYGIHTYPENADQSFLDMHPRETFFEHRPQQPEPTTQATYPTKRSGTLIALIPIIGILVIASIIGLAVGYQQFFTTEPTPTTDSAMQATTLQDTSLAANDTHGTSSSVTLSDEDTPAPDVDLTAEIIGIYPDEITVGEIINVRVQIQNTGTSTISEPFWVDLYVSPHQQPKVNDSWNTISSFGATWLVEKIEANQTMVLETLGADASRSNLLRFSTPGPQQVQVLVDSYGKETIGAIVEHNEDNNLSDIVDIHIAPGDTPEAENTF